MNHRSAVASLVAITAIWGGAFTAIKLALDDASPMVLLACRFTLATLLLAFAARGIGKRELRAGALVGVLFFLGFVFQTNGLAYTTPSRSAFITALAIPFTPLIMFAVHRERPQLVVVGGVLLAVAGALLLTDPTGGGLNIGDLLTVFSAAAFAGQIVAGGHFVRTVAPHRLLLVELALTALLSLAFAPVIDRPPRLEPSLLLAGMLAFLSITAAGTFWVQLRAQQVVSPTQTALVFSLEPVFAAVVSWAVFGELLGPVQWAGGALILAGMLLPEVGRRRSIAAPPPV